MGRLEKQEREIAAARTGGYWAEDQEFPVVDWQREVAESETRHGYHDWIRLQRGTKARRERRERRERENTAPGDESVGRSSDA